MALAQKNSPIVIIGAGVFGLSSAIHLAQEGYEDITVVDRQPYHDTLYDYARGCDAASAGNIPQAKYRELWTMD